MHYCGTHPDALATHWRPASCTVAFLCGACAREWVAADGLGVQRLPLPSERNGMNFYVVGFYFDNSRDNVLLIRKKRPAWQAGKLNGVGGHIEAGELPKEAMIREFREETELHVFEWRQFCTLTGPSYRVYFFTAFGRHVSAGCPTDEVPKWYPVVGIMRMPTLIPNLRWLIPMALDENVSATIHDHTPTEEAHSDVRKVLEDAGHRTVEGADSVRAAIAAVADASVARRCSGFGVFPDGTCCAGCSDCSMKKEGEHSG